MSVGHLYLDESRAEQGRREARLLFPDGRQASLWFETPNRRLSGESGADAFLVGSLVSWMQLGCDVHVHGSVSRTLLANLGEWQSAWARWRPQSLRPVSIEVDTVREEVIHRAQTGILAFSGGIDATYTLLRHVNGMAGWQAVPIAAAVLVQGFDIPLEDSSAFARARIAAEAILRPTGVDLVTLRTNFRELRQPWEDAHAAGIAAALMVLGPEFGLGLVASGEPYDRLALPWGSNPVTDHLLSSDHLEIRHDGAGASRSDKVRFLATVPEVVPHLRVCWQADAGGGNCGVCEKCRRTRLSFSLAGVDRKTCFDEPGQNFGRVRLRSGAQFAEWTLLADEARRLGRTDIRREAERTIRRSHVLTEGERIVGRRVRRALSLAARRVGIRG